MKTQRQVLKELLRSALIGNNTRAMLQQNGRIFTMTDGTKNVYTIVYTLIKPKTRAMYELIEEVARQNGGDVWNWYLSASDKQIDKLAKEAYRGEE